MRKKYTWLLALALVVLSPCALAGTITTIPIHKTSHKNPIPFIKVSIDGHEAGLAIITASLSLAITEPFQKQAGIEIWGESVDTTHTDDGQEKLPITQPITLSHLGKTIWFDYAFIDHIPLSNGELDGNFDPVWRMSQRSCIEIDFPAMEFRFASNKDFDTCPFVISDHHIEIGKDDTLTGTQAGQDITVMINTGSGISSISADLLTGNEKEIGETRFHQIQGIEKARLMGPFTLLDGYGDVFATDIIAVHSDPLIEGTDAAIGMDMLWGSTLIIDQGRYFWHFKKAPQ